MPRLRSGFRLVVPGRPAAAVRAELDGATGLLRGSRAGLVVRVTRDGSYVIHLPEDRSATEPVLHARVEDGPDGAVLAGRVTETRAGRFSDQLLTGLAVVMAAVTVVCVVGRVWIGAGVCGGGAVLFALSLLPGRSLRRPLFDMGIEQLRETLGRRLGVPEELPPDLPPEPEMTPEDEREYRRIAGSLLDELDAGRPGSAQRDELAGFMQRVLTGQGLSEDEARRFVDELVSGYRQAGPAELAELRRFLASDEPLG